MFGLKIISEKEYNGLKIEKKGYYDADNETNQYLRAIESHMKGRKLAPFIPMSREAIRKAYEQSAAVMGVVNYIAENVGEVARYLELQDKNDNYIWKPSLDVAKPDTILGRPIRTSSFMPGIAAGEKVLLFGDLKNYWVADRQNRTFRRLNERYADTGQVGFLASKRLDGKLILPEAIKVLQQKAG